MSTTTFFEYKVVELEWRYFSNNADGIQSVLNKMSKEGGRLKDIIGIEGEKNLIFERVNPQQADYINKLKDYLSA